MDIDLLGQIISWISPVGRTFGDEPHAEVGDATQPHADVFDVDALRLGLEFSWM